MLSWSKSVIDKKEDGSVLLACMHDIIAEGDKVCGHFKNTGTTLSGKKMELTSINIFRIVNGKVIEGCGGVIRKTTLTIQQATCLSGCQGFR